jgi:hypothetical protein
MSIKVSFTGTEGTGSARCRWYVWKKTSGGWRKERLSSYVRRLQELGHHEQVAAVMVQAIKKGYRVR